MIIPIKYVKVLNLNEKYGEKWTTYPSIQMFGGSYRCTSGINFKKNGIKQVIVNSEAIDSVHFNFLVSQSNFWTYDMDEGKFGEWKLHAPYQRPFSSNFIGIQ